jgi:hypothetical protein
MALTKAGTIMGSAHYMSPEQCMGGNVDARSDVYSLGVLAYEMLAGEKPFDAPEPLAVLYKHVNEPAPSLRAKRRRLPASVDELVRSALEKDPAKRPAGAAIFARSLRARAEGPGALLRRALILYLEHFGVFLRVTALALLPVLLLYVVELAFDVRQLVWPGEDTSEFGTTDVLTMVIYLAVASFSWAVSSGISAILLAQLARAPLRRLRLAAVWRVLRGTLLKVILGGVRYLLFSGGLLACAAFLVLIVLLGSWYLLTDESGLDDGSNLPAALFAIAFMAILQLLTSLVAAVLAWRGLKACVSYSLFPVVTVIEGAGPRGAFRRSKALVSRSPGLVAPIFFIGLLFKVAVPILVLASFESADLAKASVVAETVSSFMAELLFTPILGTAYALAYLRLREFGGESQEEVFHAALAVGER